MRVFLVCTLLAFSTVVPAFGQDTNFPNGPQYLMTSGSPLFARPIATPSLALTGPPLQTGADNATGVLFAGAQNQTALPPLAVALPSFDLFPIFYGPSQPQVIEISFAEGVSEAGEIPSSIRESGVVQMTTAQALTDRGIGVTVAVAAAHSKATAGHASYIYTNTDIERLHGTS
jgi:hypothetical protein